MAESDKYNIKIQIKNGRYYAWCLGSDKEELLLSFKYLEINFQTYFLGGLGL